MRTLAFSCLHAPYQHKRALHFLKSLHRIYNFNEIICLGDEVDQHAFSRYPTDPDLYSPGDELKEARCVLRQLARLFPKMAICKSNHTWRYIKKAKLNGLPSICLRSLSEIYATPATWNWHHRYFSCNILYFHGDKFSGLDVPRKALQKTRCNVVLGHVHTQAGVCYSRSTNQIFGMSVGCLIDETTPAFSYAEEDVNRPILGAGIIINGRPEFIPV